jgi:murein DD-endopeptidase MepM/ murein hydrolase activator NlpD
MSTSIEVSADSSNNKRQIVLADKKSEVANFVQQLYQPNFILKESGPTKVIWASSSISAPAFGDILPFYKSQGQLVDFIVLTKESLISFLLGSRALFVCAFSLFSQLINSLAYQSYLVSAEGYKQVSALPGRYTWLKEELQNLIQTFSTAQNRELWWLGFQIDSRVYLDKLVQSLNQTALILRKFYLGALVLVCLTTLFVAGQLGLGSSAQTGTEPESTLSKFIGDQSVVMAQVRSDDLSDLEIAKLSSESMVKEEASDREVNMIVEHKVAEGEDVLTIATFYGLTEETVRFNNNLKDNEEVKAGKSLYLPWSDGYIYHAEGTVAPDYLGKLYGVKADDIVDRNKAIYNSDKEIFDKGSLILVPTADYNKVAKANQQEEERKENLRRAEEERKQRLAYSAVSEGNTYIDVTSDQARREGLIWPTTGSISRCVQPGHIACDIANASQVPIFAAQSGTVSAVYRFTVVGYGLAVVIDHGNGLKTLYAHMSEIYVEAGQSVAQGQSIGRMGCTGWCTGTHLHFEVIQNGVKQNPLVYLP